MGGKFRLSRVVLAALLLALAGCGFRPLYGTHAVDPRVSEDLASIQIQPLAEREGQLVHNALLVRLNPDGEPLQPRYKLLVGVARNEVQTALQTDQTATRAEVTYAATYTLYEGDTALTKGSFQRELSYDYLQQQYANTSAASDIGARAAEEIADEIRNRMAAYFARAALARAADAPKPSSAPDQ